MNKKRHSRFILYFVALAALIGIFYIFTEAIAASLPGTTIPASGPPLFARLWGWVFVLIIGSFMPITAFSFYFFRLQEKEVEYVKIATILGLPLSSEKESTNPISREYSLGAYAFPVGMAFMLSVAGAILVFFNRQFGFSTEPHLVLMGILPINSPELDIKIYQDKSILAVSMAFLGAYIWSIQNIFRRMSAVDLPPRAFYAVSVRILLSFFVALIIRFSFDVFPEDSPISSKAEAALPAIAFLTGIFPEKALFALAQYFKIFSQNSDTCADPLPLDMIEGINLFHKVRLAEIGIDNAQNLAEADLVELVIRTPFQPSQLLDWITQAKLYTYFKHDVCKLREACIRTVLDFKEMEDNDETWKSLSEDTGIPQIHLKTAYHLINKDPYLDRLHKSSESLRHYAGERFTYMR